MFWNYRVIEHDGVFQIYEVYYNDMGDIIAITEEPMAPLGETPEELKDDMEYFFQALDRPVLRRDEITFTPITENDAKK